MATRIRELDWGTSPLGPIARWSDRLNVVVELILASPLVSSLVCGPERVLIYNDAASKLYGDRHPAALGRPLPEIFPEGWATVAPFYLRAFAGETVQVTQQPLDTRGEGDAIDVFDALLMPVCEANNHVAYVHMTGFEVGGRMRAEAALRANETRQAFLLKLSETLRPLATAGEIRACACRLLGQHLDADRTYYVEYQPSRGLGIVADDYLAPGLPSLAGSYPFKAFRATYERISDGATWIVSDVSADVELPAHEREFYAAQKVCAWVNVPLAKAGVLEAAFCVVQTEARLWTAAEIGMIENTAEHLWSAIQRGRAETALRVSEARFQQFSEASPDILWARDAETLQWDYLNPAFEDVYGLRREEALEGNDLRRWLELVVPDDRHAAMACMRRVRKGEQVTFEFRIRRPVDGQIRWLRNTDFPIFDQSGRVHRIGGIGQDITELKAIEAALMHSEQRLRTLVEGVPLLVWRAIDHGAWTWASPQWDAFTGQPEPESHHFGWLETIHPDDREMARAAWDQAMNGSGFEVEYRIRNAAQDAYRWFQTRATPVRDAAGEIAEWLGTSTDIHDLRTLQERQQVLVAELQHRTRNLMGVVRATAESTVRASTDLADFGERYRDRLNALARVQGLLSRLEGVERITFDELIQSELTAIGAINGTMGKVTLAGPGGVALRSGTVQTFALALHELATNAVKYGALASPSGRLAVTWRLELDAQREGAPWLHVDWRESGVAMPPAGALPQGTGQGRQLIERALPYQLGAKTTYVMGPDGVRCSIAVPVSSRTAVTETDDGNQPAS